MTDRKRDRRRRTEADIYEIVKMNLFLTRRGDPIATRELFDRVVGRPVGMGEIIEAESGNFSGPLMTELQPADSEALMMDGTIPAGPSLEALGEKKEPRENVA